MQSIYAFTFLRYESRQTISVAYVIFDLNQRSIVVYIYSASYPTATASLSELTSNDNDVMAGIVLECLHPFQCLRKVHCELFAILPWERHVLLLSGLDS